MPTHNSLAAVLDDLRATRGLTPAQLARGLHVSPSMVSRWLRGESVPTLKHLATVAAYFSIDRETLEVLAGYRANTLPPAQATMDPQIVSLYESTVARVRELIEGVPVAFVPSILAATRGATELARENVRAAISLSAKPGLASDHDAANGKVSVREDLLAECLPAAA